MIQIGGVYTTLCQQEGILLQKYRDRDGICIPILFKSIGVRGRFDSPDKWGRQKLLGLLGLLRNPKVDCQNPIIAIIDFQSQSEQFESRFLPTPISHPLAVGSGVGNPSTQKVQFRKS